MLHLLALAALATSPATVAVEGGDGSEVIEVDAPGETPRGIINGEPAAEEDYSMAGALLLTGRLRKDDGRTDPLSAFICSATLIAPDVVLTAAHCLNVDGLVEDLSHPLEEPAMAFLREVDVREWDLPYGKIPKWPKDAGIGHAWAVHPDYDPDGYQFSGLLQNDDIGLVWLDEPIEGELATLPTAEEGASLDEDDPVEVVGWGRRTAEDQAPSGVKYWGETTISIIRPWAMKVGELEEDVRKCFGDSGGPSFAHFDTTSSTELRQVGVTAHAWDGTQCEETGGVDTRVDFYLEWIDAEMVAACEDGTRSWCDVQGIIDAPLPGDGPLYERPGLCSTGPRGAGALGLFLVGLLVRRRRRDAISCSPRPGD